MRQRGLVHWVVFAGTLLVASPARANGASRRHDDVTRGMSCLAKGVRFTYRRAAQEPRDALGPVAVQVSLGESPLPRAGRRQRIEQDGCILGTELGCDVQSWRQDQVESAFQGHAPDIGFRCCLDLWGLHSAGAQSEYGAAVRSSHASCSEAHRSPRQTRADTSPPQQHTVGQTSSPHPANAGDSIPGWHPQSGRPKTRLYETPSEVVPDATKPSRTSHSVPSHKSHARLSSSHPAMSSKVGPLHVRDDASIRQSVKRVHASVHPLPLASRLDW